MLCNKKLELRLDLLKTLKGAVTLAVDPSRADATPDIEDGMIRLKATQVAIEYVKTLPGVAEIVQQRYLAPPPDMEALATLPPVLLDAALQTTSRRQGLIPITTAHCQYHFWRRSGKNTGINPSPSGAKS